MSSATSKKLRVIYMGKSKPSTIEGLAFLLKEGIDVVTVVAAHESELAAYATAQGQFVATVEDLVNSPPPDIDLVISFLYWRRIPKSLIALGKIGCINFHPAPLPEFRGLGGYNFAILEGLSEWAVSVHYVDENFDTGDLITVRKFAMDPKLETAFSLERKSQRHLLQLLKDVVLDVRRMGTLNRVSQGKGRYITKKDFELARKIQPGDSAELIERKIRAFWFPPHEGAYVEIAGKPYTLVSNTILKEIAHQAVQPPSTAST